MGLSCNLPLNFNPFVSRYIYEYFWLEYFRNEPEYIVFDPCMGWAGRLLGLMSMKYRITQNGRPPNVTLIGTDVNKATDERFQMINDYFMENVINRTADNQFFGENYDPINMIKFTDGAEDLHKNTIFKSYYGKGHLAFTSPPYWDREIYTAEEDQSTTRYKTYEEWRVGFLGGMLQNTFNFLKEGGFFIVNIDNYTMKKPHQPMIKHTIELALEIGFEHADTIKMLKPLNPQKRRSDRKGTLDTSLMIKMNNSHYKHEPLLVFRKPLNGEQK